MHREIKHVIFDLDGTIVDTIPDLASAAEYSVRKHKDISVPVVLAKSCIGNGLAVFLKRIFDRFSIETADFEDELLDMKSFYFAHCCEKTVLYPDTLSVLKHCKDRGIAMSVVTMKPLAPAKKILDTLGISEYFMSLTAGDTMAAPKPDAWSVNELAVRYGLQTSEILVVGDGMTDVGMAKNAGAVSAALLCGYGDTEALKKGNADHYLKSLGELTNIL